MGGEVRDIPFRPLLGSFVALFLSLLLLGRQDPIRSSTPERVFIIIIKGSAKFDF
jgi:hypothetical protein